MPQTKTVTLVLPRLGSKVETARERASLSHIWTESSHSTARES